MRTTHGPNARSMVRNARGTVQNAHAEWCAMHAAWRAARAAYVPDVHNVLRNAHSLWA